MTNAPEPINLDDLLSESLAIAGAKRAKAQGRKLNTFQQSTLASVLIAEELNLWETVKTIHHQETLHCKCGVSFTRVEGTYLYQTGTRLQTRRLVRAEPETNSPQAVLFETAKTVPFCSGCLAAVSTITAEDCDLLAELVKSPSIHLPLPEPINFAPQEAFDGTA